MADAPTPAEVEAIAEALRDAGVEVGSVGGETFRLHAARRLLASPALADLLARARGEALRDAADEVNAEGYYDAAFILRDRADRQEQAAQECRYPCGCDADPEPHCTCSDVHRGRP